MDKITIDTALTNFNNLRENLIENGNYKQTLFNDVKELDNYIYKLLINSTLEISGTNNMKYILGTMWEYIQDLHEIKYSSIRVIPDYDIMFFNSSTELDEQMRNYDDDNDDYLVGYDFDTDEDNL